MKNKKFSTKDKKLRDWLSKGGREGSKQDLLTLLKRAVSLCIHRYMLVNS